MKDLLESQQIDRNTMPVGSESLYVRHHIRTISGKYVNVFDPNPDDILIEDIAHALSHQCRFGGHLPEFYSVAQHSLECFLLASPEEELQALMHDASEAYLLDMPKPIKLGMPQYNDIEDKLMKVIADKFGFAHHKSDEVAQIDHFMLEREWDVLMLGKFDKFPRIGCVSPNEAKRRFLVAFNKIKIWDR